MVYVRKVKSRNSICFQIGRKRAGRFQLIKHVGCAPISSEHLIEALQLKSQAELTKLLFDKQLSLFPQFKTIPSAKLLEWKITGFHQIFGQVYDTIGFPCNLLRDLVVGRIVYPKSKLATINYLARYLGINLSKDKVYRFLDTLKKNELTRIAFSFVAQKNNGVCLVFYDVTTLHFATDKEDELRRKGYSKIHRHDLPQILIGLFVDKEGFPFDFDFFRGNTFEGHTFKQVVNNLTEKYSFEKLTVVADAAMLSYDNLCFLKERGINYIVGARLKNLPKSLIGKITAHDYSDKLIYETLLKEKRLIVDFTTLRARRDKLRREKQVKKLQLALSSGKQMIRKSKYLLMEQKGKVIGIDYEQVKNDQRFDGLKGYFTNADSDLLPAEVIEQYHNLWRIEKAFRISKSELKERPVYHWQAKRIHAHLLICFVSLLVMRETERVLKQRGYTIEHAIQILGKVGQGKIRIGKTVLETDSELSQDAETILELFSGH